MPKNFVANENLVIALGLNYLWTWDSELGLACIFSENRRAHTLGLHQIILVDAQNIIVEQTDI